MEELQDAIEDAQLMNAMHDGIPRPTKGWKWPSEGESLSDNDEKLQSHRETKPPHQPTILLVYETAHTKELAVDTPSSL